MCIPGGWWFHSRPSYFKAIGKLTLHIFHQLHWLMTLNPNVIGVLKGEFKRHSGVRLGLTWCHWKRVIEAFASFPPSLLLSPSFLSSPPALFFSSSLLPSFPLSPLPLPSSFFSPFPFPFLFWLLFYPFIPLSIISPFPSFFFLPSSSIPFISFFHTKGAELWFCCFLETSSNKAEVKFFK